MASSMGWDWSLGFRDGQRRGREGWGRWGVKKSEGSLVVGVILAAGLWNLRSEFFLFMGGICQRIHPSHSHAYDYRGKYNSKNRVGVVVGQEESYIIFAMQLVSSRQLTHSVDSRLSTVTNTAHHSQSSPTFSQSQVPTSSQPTTPPRPVNPVLELALQHQQAVRTLAEAKIEQDMMLELFESMAKAEEEQAPASKKMVRRCRKDILEWHYCPHDNCKRAYSSYSTLQRHIKVKHGQVTTEAPQLYRDLQPEPNLTGALSQAEPPQPV